LFEPNRVYTFDIITTSILIKKEKIMKWLEVVMKGGVDRNHNSKKEYEAGGPQLSFEFKKAKEAGLPFDVAKRIFDLSSGLAAVAYPLIDANPQSVDDLNQHIRNLDCWADGSTGEISTALARKFLG
jgi:hypothetical protein